jgi:diaminohydroxyphosphoribosylaminopyrimidine deaminase/5-amino-6-(5-phosphoribosylamino)uracil reductase
MLEVHNFVDGELDLNEMLQKLGTEGITSIFCEGGGLLGSSLIKAGLVDDLIVYSAGLVIGDDGLLRLENLDLKNLMMVLGSLSSAIKLLVVIYVTTGELIKS